MKLPLLGQQAIATEVSIGPRIPVPNALVIVPAFERASPWAIASGLSAPLFTVQRAATPARQSRDQPVPHEQLRGQPEEIVEMLAAQICVLVGQDAARFLHPRCTIVISHGLGRHAWDPLARALPYDLELRGDRPGVIPRLIDRMRNSS